MVIVVHCKWVVAFYIGIAKTYKGTITFCKWYCSGLTRIASRLLLMST